jgi:FkbM family methyltransferase
MKKLTVRIIRFILIRLIGKRNIQEAILFISHLAFIDLLTLVYQSRGILKYEDMFVSGEKFVISHILNDYIKSKNPVLFDVGANIGDYSRELKTEFPNSHVYAFEPNVYTFKTACKNLESLNINCFNVGFGSQEEEASIYTYGNEKCSEHASLYKDVLLKFHKANDLIEMPFFITTVDKFCDKKNIDFIDFMKIDVEGHELEVLKGAKRMIAEKKISIIQFEFNVCNVISRVFLKDFYELLKGYDIYRLDSDRLIPLFEYDFTNEIFKFQNFLAISQNTSKTCNLEASTT